MTGRVDFYVLKSGAATQRVAFACRLTEKAYLRDCKIIIVAGSMTEARELDEMLWSFSDRAFVPHQLLADGQPFDRDTPVHLTLELSGVPPADLLVNLAARMPTQLSQFSRVAEIVDADAERRRLGRERFKAYRELKFTMETHQIDDTADV